MRSVLARSEIGTRALSELVYVVVVDERVDRRDCRCTDAGPGLVIVQVVVTRILERRAQPLK
jgi:hypothetical protein